MQRMVFGLLLFLSGSAQAVDLDNLEKSLLKTNDELVTYMEGDLFAAGVVSKLEAGVKVSTGDVEHAYGFCVDMRDIIGTSKLRKKWINALMNEVDEELEVRLWKKGSSSADSYHHQRMRSSAIRQRLKSLLEFQAERYSRFLKVLDSASH